jgi:hypothetical protein
VILMFCRVTPSRGEMRPFGRDAPLRCWPVRADAPPTPARDFMNSLREEPGTCALLYRQDSSFLATSDGTSKRPRESSPGAARLDSGKWAVRQVPVVAHALLRAAPRLVSAPTCTRDTSTLRNPRVPSASVDVATLNSRTPQRCWARLPDCRPHVPNWSEHVLEFAVFGPRRPTHPPQLAHSTAL